MKNVLANRELVSGRMVKAVAALLLAFILLIPLCSCGKSTDDEIQGTWYYEIGDYELSFYDGNWEDSNGAYGTYTVDGDRIHLTGYDSYNPVNVMLTYHSDEGSISINGEYFYKY